MEATAPVREADPADVESIDAIVAAVYEIISGPAGAPRDWDRWYTLFAPDARLIPTVRNQESGQFQTLAQSPEEWVARVDSILTADDFFEKEIGHVTESWGTLAHRFSAYASLRSEDEEPFTRGINSFQLLHDGERWWVVTIYWQGESEEWPIPERYLQPDG